MQGEHVSMGKKEKPEPKTRNRRVGKILLVVFLFYSGSNVVFCLIESIRPLYMGIIDIGITILLFYFLWTAFAEEIQFHRDKTSRLREELKENQLFIQFGKHTAGLVHNMKSKLMSIRGFNEVLEKHVKDPKLETFLDYQKRAIDQMIDLTRNLLFSAKSFNESTTHVISLDILIKGVLEIYSSDTVFRRGVRIKKVLRQAYCVASPRDIIIMVENLITNALEAMEGTERKELQVETGMKETHSFISVSDTGEGFPFCRTHCAKETCIECPSIGYGKTTKPGGTGLGMATVRDTLKALRGDVIIESQPGEGSSVTIFLPISKTA
jgi:signal transduction histidine kinase